MKPLAPMICVSLLATNAFADTKAPAKINHTISNPSASSSKPSASPAPKTPAVTPSPSKPAPAASTTPTTRRETSADQRNVIYNYPHRITPTIPPTSVFGANPAGRAILPVPQQPTTNSAASSKSTHRRRSCDYYEDDWYGYPRRYPDPRYPDPPVVVVPQPDKPSPPSNARQRLAAVFDDVRVELREYGDLLVEWTGDVTKVKEVEFFTMDKDDKIIDKKRVHEFPLFAILDLKPSRHVGTSQGTKGPDLSGQEVVALGVTVTYRSDAEDSGADIIQTKRIPLATVMSKLRPITSPMEPSGKRN